MVWILRALRSQYDDAGQFIRHSERNALARSEESKSLDTESFESNLSIHFVSLFRNSFRFVWFRLLRCVRYTHAPSNESNSGDSREIIVIAGQTKGKQSISNYHCETCLQTLQICRIFVANPTFLDF